MGSFNTLCAASHQIIVPDEDVYLVPIIQQHSSTKVNYVTQEGTTGTVNASPSRVYNFDLYKPIGVMLKATYADYGLFDLDQSTSNLQIFHKFITILKEDLVNVAEGNNSYHEKAFTVSMLEGESLSDIWETIQEGLRSDRIFIKDSIYSLTRTPSNVSLMVVSQRSMDILFKLWDDQSPRSYSAEYNKIFDLSFEDRFKHYTNQLEILTNSEIYPTNLYFSDIRETNYWFLDTLRDNGCSSISPIDLHLEFIADLQTNSDLDICFQKFTSYHRLRHLIDIFQTLNIIPSPMWYASQDYANSSGFLYSIFMNELYKDNIQKAKDFDEDIEDSSQITDEEVIKKALEYF